MKAEDEPEPEVAMCSYTEYDHESGETYGCGLKAHGPKVKHTRGKRFVARRGVRDEAI